jgi:hypothetical protein
MSSPPAEPSFPIWALARVDAALKLGQSLPEIEQGLVAKGLPPTMATAVVTNVLASQVRTSRQTGPSKVSVLAHRIAVVVAIVVCLGLAYANGGRSSAGRTALLLVLPVGLIWFPGARKRLSIAERDDPSRTRSYWWLANYVSGRWCVTEGDKIVLKVLDPWIPWFCIGAIFVMEIVLLMV